MNPLPFPAYVTRPVLPSLELLAPQLREIWDSKWLTNHGAKHNQLEAALGNYLGVPQCSAFNNGTIALLVAIKALDLPAGSEIITTPFTFAATPHCISWNGLRPVFCDIRPDTMVIDAEKIERLVNKKTSAILGVHVYGFPCPVDEIDAIAKRHGLAVIYDAAHAFGTRIGSRGIGSFGDLSMFSFHPTKLFHTVEGGCLTYSRPELERKIYFLRNFGIKNEEEVVDIGINGKMNEIQAAVGLLNLELVPQEQARRIRIRALYEDRLASIPGLEIPKMPQNVTDSCQYFVVRIDAEQFGMSRDTLYDRLKAYNVYARKYFYPLCSDYTPYQSDLSSSPDNLPVANRLKHQVLCLPFYGELADEHVTQIGDIVRGLRG